MATGGEVQEVQSVNIGGLNTGNVSESLGEFNVLVGVHDQRSFLNSVSSVSEFSFSSSQRLSVANSLDIGIGTNSLKELNGILGLLVALKSVINNERELGDALNSVTSGGDEREEG